MDFRTTGSKLSRRQLITRLGALGLSTSAIGSLLAACSPSAEQPSPRSSSIRPAVSSSAAATASCRLPVSHYEDTGQPGGRIVSGFLTYPSRQFEPDPRGAYAWDDARKAYRSPIAPVLYGPGRTAFSRSTSRWVPVGSDSLSPDGLHYAYAEPFQGRLHLVTVKSGDDRIITLPAGEPYAVARFVADGIYLMFSWEGLPRGLYKVELPSGRLTTISEEVLPAAVEPGVAWLFAIVRNCINDCDVEVSPMTRTVAADEVSGVILGGWTPAGSCPPTVASRSETN